MKLLPFRARRPGNTVACGLVCAALVAGVAHRARADAPLIPHGVRADGIASIVGGTVGGAGAAIILRSDVLLGARIALSGRMAGSAAEVRLPASLLAATLDQIVGEVLIAREAERVRVAAPSRADLRRELVRLRLEAGSQRRFRGLIDRLGVSQVELDALVRRRALVTSFMRANLEGTGIVTDAEVDRAYAAGEHPFTDQALPEVREELRAWLSRMALERAVRRWVGVLRARTTVRLLVHYGEGAGS